MNILGSPAQDMDDGVRDVSPRLLAPVYCVFNESQVEGPPCYQSAVLSEADRIAAAESLLSFTGASVRHGGDRACYIPGIDQICMPHFAQFRDAGAYYSTLAHECVHWTGARHRLDRDFGDRFGSQAYAMEELVAELGAAFICAHLGISVEPRPEHAAYIGTWLSVLRSQPRAILTASAKAQEAADFLIRHLGSISHDPVSGCTA
jgi:antirestriction protein ArdC